MPGRYDMSISQGTTFSETFQYRESDGTTVIPLTGATAKAQIRNQPGTLLLTEFDVDIDGAGGAVTLSLDDDQTKALPAGRNQYDILVTLTDGEIFVLVEGAANVDGTVTQLP
jgi:hypothetical protein